MKNLVTIQEAKVVTSSLQVSQTFGKEHRNVLRDIQNLVAQNSAANSFFIESDYENRGKSYPMYIINRDGFTLLAMGFTGKKALQFKIDYINAFNQMEKYIKQSHSQPLPKRKYVLLQERIIQLEEQNKELLADKIFFRDALGYMIKISK